MCVCALARALCVYLGVYVCVNAVNTFSFIVNFQGGFPPLLQWRWGKKGGCWRVIFRSVFGSRVERGNRKAFSVWSSCC